MLLVGVAAVCAHRMTLLSRPRFVPAAHSEKRFWNWSYRDPAVYAALARSEGLFRPGDAVCVESPSPSLDRDWLFSIAAYYLSQQIVATSRADGTAGGPVCRRTRLVLGRDGSAHRSKGVASGDAQFVP